MREEASDYIAINREAWDRRTETHITSRFYDVTGFINGNTSLNPAELALMGDVRGKDLLHLQCHFGLDTLSWARLGARVTGVDLSPAAISKAEALAAELQLDARFINDDLYSFGEGNTQEFDTVFTSYGTVCWLPDLDRWASTIMSALKPDGQFVLVEFHPLIDLLQGYSYFPTGAPDIEEAGTYTENSKGEKSLMAVWSHSLAEVLQALLRAGLIIDYFEEHAFSPYNCFPNLEFVEGQGYQMLLNGRLVPLLYSLKGRKRT